MCEKEAIDILLMLRYFIFAEKEENYQKYVDAITLIVELYNKQKERIKELEKQLQDIHDNFCQFNWQESNAKQMHNQLTDLYESINRK